MVSAATTGNSLSSNVPGFSRRNKVRRCSWR